MPAIILPNLDAAYKLDDEESFVDCEEPQLPEGLYWTPGRAQGERIVAGINPDNRGRNRVDEGG